MSSISNQDAHQGGDLNDMAKDGTKSLYNNSSLRSTASRFSLNEQFAATRREYEFGYDDASSILEQATIRSRHLHGELDTPSVLTTSAEGIAEFNSITPLPLGDDNFYDILCMTREPSIESILRVYSRLLCLLNPDQQPPHLRQVAEAYSVSIQRAIQALLDPYQQTTYGLALHDRSPMSLDATDDQRHLEYNGRMFHTTRSFASLNREVGEFELGAGFDIQQTMSHGKHSPSRAGAGFKLVNFEMRHATSIDLSELDGQLCRATQWLQQQLTANDDKATDRGCMTCSEAGRLGGTVMTLQGSVYGLLKDRTSIPLSFDRYQPSFPLTSNRERFVLLHHGLLHPLAGINLRHVIPQSCHPRGVTDPVQASAPASCCGQEETVVEIGSTILPNPTATTRLSKTIVLPFDRHKSFLSLETEQTLRERKLPGLAATLERPTAGGQLLLHVASGDWHSHEDETCRHFTDLTKTNRQFSGIALSPQIEIAFKNRGTFELQESCFANHTLGQGIRALDTASDTSRVGVWTVTASAEHRYYSVSAKYARDVDLAALVPYQHRSMSLKTSNAVSTSSNSITRRRLRMETEIGSNSFNTGYLALRLLKRAGRFSKVGFEMGLGTYSVNLSVYWSRLGRRINVPFYLCSRASINLQMLLLITMIPFASITLWELWDRFRQLKRCQRQLDALKEQHYIQKRRAEADTVMTLMAPAVQNKQKLESMGNGLVILSAKYGVKARDAGEATAWGAAEVADVTVAVAALVDRGRLFIAPGVRKSYILGFWDPDPAEEKVLHVRYSYRGKEATVEVRGDDEQLVLPPPS
ncbi:hypothetical protein F5Y09DRAFT_350444 [Xylaria sp. FL1042]|nr:hypothetical protein F5Y09DRAFT_350444 [Xylaria sp. FL1042]